MGNWLYDLIVVGLSLFVASAYGLWWWTAYWAMAVVVILLHAIAVGIYDGIKDAIEDTGEK